MCVITTYFQCIFRECFKDELRFGKDDIKINGIFINNVRFADDFVILDNFHVALHGMMNLVAEQSSRYGLHVNVTKTEVLSCFFQRTKTSHSADQ